MSACPHKASLDGILHGRSFATNRHKFEHVRVSLFRHGKLRYLNDVTGISTIMSRDDDTSFLHYSIKTFSLFLTVICKRNKTTDTLSRLRIYRFY